MASLPRRAGTRLMFVLGIVLSLLVYPLTAGSPAAFAQEALYPGANGLVANTGGEAVLLRETPSWDAVVVSSYFEGTPADVVEGPVYSEDGAAWFGVSIGGTFGYMAAGYLAAGWETTEPAPVEMAAAAAPVETAPAPVDPASTAAGVPVATADLNLRAGPTYDDMVLAIVPAGAPLTTTGEWLDGFAGVVYNGQYGWVDSAWLGSGEAAPAQAPVQEVALLQEAVPAVDQSTLMTDMAQPAGTQAQAIDVANLRLGPSEGDEVLRVLPAGAAVTITGETADGWTPVWYNGTWGFISSGLLTTDGAAPVTLAQDAAFETYEATDDGSGELLATTLSDVNLRSGPDTVSPILATIPAGVELFPLAGPEAGFYQVDANGQVGWVSAEYLQVTVDYLQKGKRNKNQSGKVEGSEPATNAGSGGIIWPVSGGEWSIMQGYNGSSHQNQDSLWQYYYSLDLVRNDGGTAGQTVYSPVNGTVRWTDPGSGGMSIDMGDGYAVAMFHVTFDGSLQAGTPVSQGQPIGTISGSGGPGFAGTPHLHFTLWTSDDNGNWDREAEPFVGKYAISGMEFPDTGGRQQHSGTTFYP